MESLKGLQIYVYEIVLPPFSQTSGTSYYACLRCSRIRNKMVDGDRNQNRKPGWRRCLLFLLVYKHLFSRLNLTSYIYIPFFTFPKEPHIRPMEIKTRRPATYVESPASVFSLQNLLPKVTVTFCMDLQIFAPPKTTMMVPHGDPKASVSIVMCCACLLSNSTLKACSTPKCLLSAFSPTSQSLLSKTRTNGFYGSWKQDEQCLCCASASGSSARR